MKKIAGLVLTTLLMGIGATTAQADDIKSATKVDTKAKVTFDVDDEAETGPVDPENPEKPIDPEEGGEGEGGGKGALRIDWAPAFNFGSKEIKEAGGISLPVVRAEGQTTAHFIQVSDLRAIEGSDWKLSVTASDLTSGSNKIAGAKLNFAGQTAKMIDDAGSIVPVPNGPTWATETIAFDGSTQTLVTAKGDGALGTSSMAMSDKSKIDEATKTDGMITLNIPSTSAKVIKKGDYTAILNWELSSDVTASETFMSPITK